MNSAVVGGGPLDPIRGATPEPQRETAIEAPIIGRNRAKSGISEPQRETAIEAPIIGRNRAKSGISGSHLNGVH